MFDCTLLGTLHAFLVSCIVDVCVHGNFDTFVEIHMPQAWVVCFLCGTLAD